MKSFTLGTRQVFKCPKSCDDILLSVGDLISHLKMHKRQHIQYRGFDSWLRKKFYLWDLIEIPYHYRQEYYSQWKYEMSKTCMNLPCLSCLSEQTQRAKDWKEKHKKHNSNEISLEQKLSKKQFRMGSCTSICNRPKYIDGKIVSKDKCGIKCEGNHSNSMIHFHVFGGTHNLVHVFK